MTENTEPEFSGKIETVPVGDKYESVTVGDRTISKGDVVAFDDPDIDDRDHDRGVHTRAFIGYVEAVLDPSFNSEEPEIFATTRVGRVPVGDVEVSGEGSRIDPQTGLQKFAEQLLSSDHDALMMEWGEDIDGSGDDHKRTWD